MQNGWWFVAASGWLMSEARAAFAPSAPAGFACTRINLLVGVFSGGGHNFHATIGRVLTG